MVSANVGIRACRKLIFCLITATCQTMCMKNDELNEVRGLVQGRGVKMILCETRKARQCPSFGWTIIMWYQTALLPSSGDWKRPPQNALQPQLSCLFYRRHVRELVCHMAFTGKVILALAKPEVCRNFNYH